MAKTKPVSATAKRKAKLAAFDRRVADVWEQCDPPFAFDALTPFWQTRIVEGSRRAEAGRRTPVVKLVTGPDKFTAAIEETWRRFREAKS